MAKYLENINISLAQNGYLIRESYRDDAPKKGDFGYIPDDPPVVKEKIEDVAAYVKDCLTKNKPKKRYAAQNVSAKPVTSK